MNLMQTTGLSEMGDPPLRTARVSLGGKPMSQEWGRTFQSARTAADRADALETHLSESRKELINLNTRIRALEICLEEVRAEHQKLSGLGLTSLLHKLLGRRDSMLADLQADIRNLEGQLEECRGLVSMCEQEMGQLQTDLRAFASQRSEFEDLLAEKQRRLLEEGGEVAQQWDNLVRAAKGEENRICIVDKAIAAGKEALKDLQSEMETISTLGRCRVAEGGKAISHLMNIGRKSTADGCSDRVKAGIRRFVRFMENVRLAVETSGDQDFAETENSLRGIEQDFDGSWLASASPDAASAPYVMGELRMALMLLEARKGGLVKTHQARVQERDRFLADARLSEGA